MKKLILLSITLLFLGIVTAQITKKEPRLLEKKSTKDTITFQTNKLPDRLTLKKLPESEYSFDKKSKIIIDSIQHWYALENINDETYWKNVDCKKIIIEFKKDISVENPSVKEFLKKVSLTKIIEKSMFPEIQNFYVFEVSNGNKLNVLSIIKSAKEFNFILYAEPCTIFKQNVCQPNDPYYNQQWGPYVMYADSVWCYFTGGSNNWLAVIDDAVDWYHPDLYDVVWYGYDFAMNDADPTPDNGQEHGTHVTGTVGATINNGIGVAGMLGDTIFFAKVTDNTSTFSDAGIVNALNTIASNSKIRVINMSFGSYAQNSAIETALQNAYNNGKLLIAAAGNDATSNPMYPASYTLVVCVSAVGVDGSGNLTDASYSNYGSTIDVSAPGGESSTGYPIISTLPSNNYGGALWQGTSMASPHVTGVAGMVFAVNPLLTNVQARTIIEQQVFDLGNTGWDPLFGSGMVCAWCAFEEACNQLSITISSGSTTFCTGGSVVLNAVNNLGISYQWQKNGVNISSATSNSYTVTQSGTYSLQIKTLGGVCQANSNSIVITVNPLPANAGTISGTATVCQGQNTVTYTVPTIANATSYSWTLPSGATGTSTTNSITVNYGTSAISGNITVKGTNSCGNGATSTLVISVNPLPASAGTISGTTTVCQGQNTVTYTVPTITNATSYIWSLPSGASGTSTTNSINVNYGTSAISGNITVKGTNSCGNGTTSTLVITVNQLPSTANVTGSVSPCENTSQTYTATSTGATSYIWSLPATWTGSSTTNTINATIGNGSGSVCSTPVNSCGNGTQGCQSATVSLLPTTASVSGNAAPNQGASETYTATSTGATSYIWSLPAGWSGSSTTSTINVTVGSISGNVCATPVNSCGNGTQDCQAISIITSIDESTTNNNVKIYPNPTNGFINISFSEAASNVDIEIYDLLGKQVHHQNMGNITKGSIQTINLNGFADGIYYMRIATSKTTSNHKLLLNR